MSRSRQEEHQAFLNWLLDVVQKQNIDVFIVAGDIFDTTTPPNYALELYYNFLTRLTKTSCKNVVITAGNHDSIATLKAPKQLLKAFNIHVVTSGEEEEEELIPIYKDEKLQCVVCAVPFLRDFVLRKSLKEETLKEKENALSQGIKEHYNKVYKEALKVVNGEDVPIVATGHLTTLGAKTSESEREIYIGGSASVSSDIFSCFDYVALGHLHTNQQVLKNYICYSGSVIPLSFSEADSSKKVNIVEFKGKKPSVELLDIPLYRKLLVFRGDVAAILSALKKVEDKNSWIEVHLEDDNPYHANEVIRSEAESLGLTLLGVKIQKEEHSLDKAALNVLSLEELQPKEVFLHRLAEEDIKDEALKKALEDAFDEIVYEVQNR